MYIDRLILQNFRNYDNLNIEFSPGLNFIIGENGIGKTNILEAIYIASNIRSFRNIPDSEIIRWGENYYYCKSLIKENEYRKFEVGCNIDNGNVRKKIKIDDREIKKASDYFGKLLTVVFIPVDINIVSGSPDLRRRFFDSVISKIDPSYFEVLNKYKKILSSRNTILKQLKEKRSNYYNELDIWDSMFADSSYFIVKKREEFIEEFSKLFSLSYEKIAGTDSVPVIEYNSSIKSMHRDEILSELQQRRDKDILFGSTGIGPQRDDYLFLNNKRLFVNYASQGQKRIAAISLKISECDIIEKITEKKSLILIDDIFSELDKNRRENMIGLFQRGNQVIFTMTNSGYFDSMNVISTYKRFLVNYAGITEN